MNITVYVPKLTCTESDVTRRNPTVITVPQIGPRHPQTVTVQIRLLRILLRVINCFLVSYLLGV